MTALSELLGRVEAATKRDKELDFELARWEGWTQHTDEDDPVFVRQVSTWWAEPGREWSTCSYPPSYTRSMDATMALAKRLGFYIRSEPRFHIDGERVTFNSHALRPLWDHWRPDDEWFDRGQASHSDQVLSALAALLKALIASAAATPKTETSEKEG